MILVGTLRGLINVLIMHQVNSNEAVELNDIAMKSLDRDIKIDI